MTAPVRGDGLLPPTAYTRDDDTPDDRFYSVPRKVVHLDDDAIAALGHLYATVLPPDGRLLDLMSSWRSHLPAGSPTREIVGLGLNGLHPLALFRDVRRVLRPGASFVVSFSNRCFPTKAVAVWLDGTDEQHVALVRAYFEHAGGFTGLTAADRSPSPHSDPLYAVWARAASARI